MIFKKVKTIEKFKEVKDLTQIFKVDDFQNKVELIKHCKNQFYRHTYKKKRGYTKEI